MGWGRRRLALAIALGALLVPGMALAQEEDPGSEDDAGPEEVRASVVEIRPAAGASVVYEGRRYGGTLRLRGHGGGMSVVESVSLDTYLAGIQEVPFSWEPAALEAQAIAARTYLAWTLARGRTSSGQRFGYDICATDACQVYAGREPSLTDGGERWLEAVRETGSQILVHDGEPALTYYSSTSGGRTRTVGDVFVGEPDRPYLQAVESPGEDSPFAEWTWWLPAPAMARLMTEAGLASGRLIDITTTTTADGEGPWTVTIESEGGARTVSTWEMRGALNRAGPVALPDLLPAHRPDGPRYPQTILSPTFTIESVQVPVNPVFRRPLTFYRVAGRGWGHLVGMSQYGAQAMAERGVSAPDILAHFYGGLRPVEAPDLVPDVVQVALATTSPGTELSMTGPVSVSIDGEEVATDELGGWAFRVDAGSLVVTPPVGLGLPPRIRPGRLSLDGLRIVLRPEVTAAATVEWRLTVDGVEVASFGPEAVDAGLLSIPLPLTSGDIGLVIEAVNAHGEDRLALGGGSE